MPTLPSSSCSAGPSGLLRRRRGYNPLRQRGRHEHLFRGYDADALPGNVQLVVCPSGVALEQVQLIGRHRVGLLPADAKPSGRRGRRRVPAHARHPPPPSSKNHESIPTGRSGVRRSAYVRTGNQALPCSKSLWSVRDAQVLSYLLESFQSLVLLHAPLGEKQLSILSITAKVVLHPFS